MFKKNFRIFLLAIIAIPTVLLVSCTKETAISADDFATESVVELETRDRLGKNGCFELVYPISIAFADSTTTEVNSVEELKTTIKEWKVANPDATVKPTLVYPIEVITKSGETMTVNSSADLKGLEKDCKPKGNSDHGKACFKMNFPVSMLFPNGVTKSFVSAKELKTALRSWKKANPGQNTVIPTLVYPINVTLKDGTTTTLNSKEELVALKEDCRD